MKRLVIAILAVLISGLVAVIIAQWPLLLRLTLSPEHRFRLVSVGMPRERVEQLLGPPFVAGTTWSEYIERKPPTKVDLRRSPSSFGLVRIEYSEHGTVTKKHLFLPDK